MRVSQYVVPDQAKNSYQIASNCRLSRSSSRAFNRCRYSSPHPALPPCPVTRPLHAITHFNRPPSLNCLPGCRFLAHVSALSRSFSPLLLPLLLLPTGHCDFFIKHKLCKVFREFSVINISCRLAATFHNYSHCFA